MPYFVSWNKDGRIRRFAYPHTDLETALGFAFEVLETECDDVWISDENGHRVADRAMISEYAADGDEMTG